MCWTLRAMCLGITVCAIGLFTAEAQEKQARGATNLILGKVKSVDPDKGTLTITTAEGKTRTFTVTEATKMVGPRGGQATRRGAGHVRNHRGLACRIVESTRPAGEMRPTKAPPLFSSKAR